MADGIVAEGCPVIPEPPAPAQEPTLVDLDEWSSLCSSGHTANIVTGAILRFLQEHFSSPDNIENQALKDNIFRQDPEDTTQGVTPKGILIDPIYKWNPRDFSLRPAVYIKRNGMQIQRLGINDGLTTGLGLDAGGQLKTYEGEYHVVGVMGSHSVFCIGRSGAEAEVLAGEVFQELQHFTPVLRRDLKLKKLGVTEITELQQLEEYDQHFVAAVVLAWGYFEKWRLREVAPWLKSFQVELIPSGEDRKSWLAGQ